MEPRINVRKMGDNIITFQTDVYVGRTESELYAKWLIGGVNWYDICLVQGRIVADMVMAVLDVDGVQGIFVKRKEVTVHLCSEHEYNIEEVIKHIVKHALSQMYKQNQHSKIVICDNKHLSCVTYNSNFSLSNCSRKIFDWPLEDRDKSILKKIGPKGARLVRMILDISGVISVVVARYELNVSISEAFGWSDNDIEGDVEKAFNKVFGQVLFIYKKL